MLDNSSEASGCLYVVATPIGNLDDMSARALATLAAVDLVAAEDTRHTGQLLSHFGIRTSLLSLHEHNEQQRLARVLRALGEGLDVALVSDAGTPLISDPGYALVRAAQDAGVAVVPVPGPSAVMAALSVAGLPTDRFAFEGFLPARSGARANRLRELAMVTATLVFFEAPRRVAGCLAALAESFGAERPAAIARELTKHHEQVLRAPLGELLAAVESGEVVERGEFVLVVAGRGAQAPSANVATEHWLRALLEVLSPADAARVAARVTGGKRAEIYRQLLAMQGHAGTP